jgi:hypothetical protein
MCRRKTTRKSRQKIDVVVQCNSSDESLRQVSVAKKQQTNMKVDVNAKFVVEYKSSDKVNWLQNHTLTVEQRKELIDKKAKRLYNQYLVNTKSRAIFSEY